MGELKLVSQAPESVLLCRNHISEVQLADAFSGVVSIDVSCNSLETLAGIERAAHLRVLKANQNMIFDISALEGLTQLKVLELSHNKIIQVEQLEPLAGLKLESLTLHDPRCADADSNTKPNAVIFDGGLEDYLVQQFPRLEYNPFFRALPKHAKELFGSATVHLKAADGSFEYEGDAVFQVPHGKGKLQ